MNVYSLAIEELNGKTVRLLVTDDGRALCVPGTYGLGPSRVDATGLRFTGDRLEGPIQLTVEPDAWFPPDRKPLSCRLELDARLRDGLVTGTAGPCRLSGTVAAEDPLQDPAHWVLTIEQVAPDWPPHMGRGELVVAAGECLLRSPVAHAWIGRVEHANLNLTGGRVQAVVGMQPGGTGLGSERVVCELDMTVINRTIAGCCTVTGEDGQPQRRGLRGRIVAGHPARARAVVAAGPATLAIDVRSLRASRSVRPWRSLDFSDVRHGRFAGLADLDGDGMGEILSAGASQPLGIAGLLAMRLDGTRLWQWGEIGVGCPPGDPAVQTADLDGDGREEIYVAGRGSMVVIEAASGRELRRWPLPADLPWSDCIIVANLRGLARPGDLLIKDRHGVCYAFTASGEPLWRWQDPAGRSIAHHPLIVDVDRDGRDEVLIGWTLLRSDGTPLWDLKSDLCDFRNGHLDSAAVVETGATPAETLIAVCYDEANGLALVNGAGQTQWEVCGSHFHTLCAGPMLPGVGGSQVLCTLARLKHWCWRAWLMHLDGRLAAEYLGLYLPAAMDWDGDGHLELIGGSGIVLRATGEPLADLVDEQGRELGVSSPDVIGHRPYLCDLDGDGQSELLLFDARGILRIYRSPDVSPLPGRRRIGTWNYTDYECPAVPPPRRRHEQQPKPRQQPQGETDECAITKAMSVCVLVALGLTQGAWAADLPARDSAVKSQTMLLDGPDWRLAPDAKDAGRKKEWFEAPRPEAKASPVPWAFIYTFWRSGSSIPDLRWNVHVSELIRRDRNHPRIVAWGLGNEGAPKWAKTSLPMIRELDQTRMVFPDSFFGCGYANPGGLTWLSDVREGHPYGDAPVNQSGIHSARNYKGWVSEAGFTGTLDLPSDLAHYRKVGQEESMDGAVGFVGHCLRSYHHVPRIQGSGVARRRPDCCTHRCAGACSPRRTVPVGLCSVVGTRGASVGTDVCGGGGGQSAGMQATRRKPCRNDSSRRRHETCYVCGLDNAVRL